MSLRIKCFAVVAVAALLMCADMSWAQPGGRGRGGGGFFGRGGQNNASGLLGREDIQKELGLVEDQIEEFKERQQEIREDMRDMFSGMREAEDRRAFFEERREKVTAKTNEFNEWISAQGLERGEIVGRNSENADWFTKVNFKMTQELPGFMPGHKGEVFFVIDNLTNMLNDDWGVLKTGSALQSAVSADIVNGQYVFNEFKDPSGTSIESRPSLWEMRVGVKYTF